MTKSLLRAAGVTLLALAVGACSHPAPPAPPPPEVGVIDAHPQNVPLTGSFVGRVSAFRTADIYARVPGVIVKRTYKEGSEVKAGQLLFQIDPAPFKATLDNALGQLAEAQAAYTNATVQLQQAVALAPKGYISKSALVQAQATERSDKAAVQAAQATVETARINLGYASVRSPIAGRAGEQQITEGALVSQSTPTLLTTVDQIDPLYVNFTISVGQLDELRQNQQQGGVTLTQPDKATAKVTLSNGTPYPESGTLDFSSVNVNPSTGAVNLRALLPNPRHTLLPGSFVTLDLDMGERHNAFLIPQAAVQRDISGTYVLIVGKDGKVANQDVTTSGTSGVDWIVTSGLTAGDKVIVSGIQAVEVGKPARTQPWQPPASAPTMTAGAPASSMPAGSGTY
ncbi:MAG: efflux RND transporter periplasmic adaptor subunit [Rhodanobacteraceae bacterium]